MDSDLSNPAALAFWDSVDEAALEATIRPQAVFADVQLQGTVTDGPSSQLDTMAMPIETPSAPVVRTGIDPKWLAVLAVAVLAIGALVLLKDAR